jgi:Rieske Fe-S protein
VLASVGLAGLAGAISACSAGGSSSSTASAPAATTQGGGAAATTSAAPAGGASALTTTSKIPVGGGMIFTAEKVVITQPTAGEFKGFSAVCTHMGCIVNKISNGTIDCPCHGSQYSIKNGDVVGGPAPNPLPDQPIKVSGSDIFLG